MNVCIAAERYTGHASLVRFTFLAHVHHVQQQQQSHFLVVIEWLKKNFPTYAWWHYVHRSNDILYFLKTSCIIIIHYL